MLAIPRHCPQYIVFLGNVGNKRIVTDLSDTNRHTIHTPNTHKSEHAAGFCARIFETGALLYYALYYIK